MITRLLRNFSWLTVAAALELGMSMALSVVLARRLGPGGYGQYSLWFAFITLFTPIYDFGLTPYSLREVAQKPEQTLTHVNGARLAKAYLSLLGLVVLFVVALRLRYFSAPAAAAAFLLLAVSQILRSFALLNRAVFRAHEQMRMQAQVEALGGFARLSVILAVALLTSGLLWVCAALAVVNLGELLLSSLVVRHLHRAPSSDTASLPGEQLGVRALLKASTPFALYDAFNALYMRADFVIVGTLAGLEPVGWYSSAYKIASLVAVFPRTLVDGLYPILCKESHERVFALVRQLLICLLCLAFPICLLVTVYAPEIITLVYGDAFEPAVPALRVLSWTTFFVFGSALILATLNALHLETLVARLTGAVSLLGVVSYLLAVRSRGYMGAAITSTALEAATFALMLWFLTRKSAHPLLSAKSALRIGFTYAATAGLVYWLTATISKAGAVAIGLVFYAPLALYEINRSTSAIAVAHRRLLEWDVWTRLRRGSVG